MDITQTHLEKSPALPHGLPFGEGIIGRDYMPRTPESESRLAEDLAGHTRELTRTNMADCIDGRKTLRLARTPNGLILVEQVVPQLPGGTFLSATKAAVTADARLVSDAKDMWDAYLKVGRHLEEWGEEDAAHEDCGASKNVEKSAERRVDPLLVVSTVCSLAPGSGEVTRKMATQNLSTKQALYRRGFYSGWDPRRHADYVANRYPENFSYLETSDDETHGHYEAGLYLITSEDKGFAKNAFVESTGGQAFAATVPKMRQLADRMGGSNEERERIFLAFIDDALHVANGLVAEGIPVFSEAA